MDIIVVMTQTHVRVQIRHFSTASRIKFIVEIWWYVLQMDFAGNLMVIIFSFQFCRKVWLGLYDSRKNPEPDSKDENKIRDFMINKYEKKRWYCAPTETMHEDARKMNTPAAKPDARSQRLANAVNISSQVGVHLI